MEQSSKAYMGRVIRDLRNDKNMKSEELASMLVPVKTAGTVTAWERGETEPSSDYIMQMCEIFDVEPAFFFRSRKAPELEGFELAKMNTLSTYYTRMTDTQRKAVLAVASAMVDY